MASGSRVSRSRTPGPAGPWSPSLEHAATAAIRIQAQARDRPRALMRPPSIGCRVPSGRRATRSSVGQKIGEHKGVGRSGLQSGWRSGMRLRGLGLVVALAACGGGGAGGDWNEEDGASLPEVYSFGAVWAFAPDDVWVAGSAILHFDGTAWTKVVTPTI